MKIVARCAALLIGIGGITALAAGDGFVDLFNGKDIDGWIQRGGKAKYSVEDGALVGESVLKTENTFLCPPKEYGNFILEYDFKVDPRLNSGVQIRSQCFDEATVVKGKDGKEIKVGAKRVHGYQIEIDNDPVKKRWWTAGLYEEGCRGWIFPGFGGGDAKAFTAQGGKITKVDDWNHVKIEAIGDHFRTWLNGEQRVDAKDDRIAKGFFGFQVHGIGGDTNKVGTKVHWKNIRIKEVTGANGPEGEKGAAGEGGANTLTDAEKTGGWKLLFDGKSLDQWQGLAKPEIADGWKVADGTISITKNSKAGDIITKDVFGNFDLKFDFRLTKGANSGVKYFVDPKLASGGHGLGCEFQCLDDANHPDAKLGHDGNRTVGSLYDVIPAAESKKVNPVGEWNSGRVVVKGHHVEHWLNGSMVVEYDRGTDTLREAIKNSKFSKVAGFGEWTEGHLLLQDHNDEVSFRNIKIKILPPSEPPAKPVGQGV